jgi:hypothetical protein
VLLPVRVESPWASVVESSAGQWADAASPRVSPAARRLLAQHRPHRLAAKDSAPSGRERRFEFSWGHHSLAATMSEQSRRPRRSPYGRLTQRESASLTRRKSGVQIPHRPPATSEASAMSPGPLLMCYEEFAHARTGHGFRELSNAPWSTADELDGGPVERGTDPRTSTS